MLNPTGPKGPLFNLQKANSYQLKKEMIIMNLNRSVLSLALFSVLTLSVGLVQNAPAASKSNPADAPSRGQLEAWSGERRRAFRFPRTPSDWELAAPCGFKSVP